MLFLWQGEVAQQGYLLSLLRCNRWSTAKPSSASLPLKAQRHHPRSSLVNHISAMNIVQLQRLLDLFNVIVFQKKVESKSRGALVTIFIFGMKRRMIWWHFRKCRREMCESKFHLWEFHLHRQEMNLLECSLPDGPFIPGHLLCLFTISMWWCENASNVLFQFLIWYLSSYLQGSNREARVPMSR